MAKKSLSISKGYSESVHRKTENTSIKRKRSKGQTIYKILLRKTKIEQHNVDALTLHESDMLVFIILKVYTSNSSKLYKEAWYRNLNEKWRSKTSFMSQTSTLSEFVHERMTLYTCPKLLNMVKWNLSSFSLTPSNAPFVNCTNM